MHHDIARKILVEAAKSITEPRSETGATRYLAARLDVGDCRIVVNRLGKRCVHHAQFFGNLSGSDLFVTMFYLQYHPQDRLLTYTSAGHNNPLLWRTRQQRLEMLDAEGLIFGIRKEVEFEEKQAQLEPGDILLLYTDGIIEAEDNNNEFFGIERLSRLVQECDQLSPQELIDRVMNQVRIFTGLRHFNDDISLVVMKVLK